MKTLSLDLRERILASYDNGEGTRDQIALRYRVSVGMVKKLLQQRRRIGEIGSQYYRSGRKPRILECHRQELRNLLASKPDLTLAELRQATNLDCTLPAIHYALAKLDLTYKKRVCMPASKTDRM
jgi:transposase